MRTLVAFLLLCSTALAQELRKPIQLKAGDQPIDTEVGHAGPFVYDWDGDGKRDLLVGQFGGGKLKIYRNLGTNEQPKFGEPEWFKVGGEVVTTPTG